jgi:hypothetical protein
LAQEFEVRCADVHSPGCEQALRGPRCEDVVELVCAHGALAHGFTSVWYSPQRLASIAGAVRPCPGR